jgi:hypothetical protein
MRLISENVRGLYEGVARRTVITAESIDCPGAGLKSSLADKEGCEANKGLGERIQLR